jgi:hypothetical protein
MKKFSKLTNQTIGEEPKREATHLTEEGAFRYKVMSLMEDFLTIRTYGPIDRYLRAGSIKVVGKEDFLEALMSLISDKSIKDQSSLLEGLKSDISDWESIDSKKMQIESAVRKERPSKERKNMISFLERYGSDEGTLEMVTEMHASKIECVDIARSKATTARQLAIEDVSMASKFEKVANIFENRAKYLES